MENDLPEEQKVVSVEIAALDTALSEEEKKVSRRSALSESLPKTEMSLAERDKDITARSTALEADRASLSEKKNQRNAAKETSLDKGTQRKTTENELPSLTQCTA